MGELRSRRRWMKLPIPVIESPFGSPFQAVARQHRVAVVLPDGTESDASIGPTSSFFLLALRVMCEGYHSFMRRQLRRGPVQEVRATRLPLYPRTPTDTLVRPRTLSFFGFRSFLSRRRCAFRFLGTTPRSNQRHEHGLAGFAQRNQRKSQHSNEESGIVHCLLKVELKTGMQRK